MILLSLAFNPAFAQQPNPAARTLRLIEVRGEAMMEIVPDLAIVSLGVVNRGDDPVAVMAANAANIRKIIVILQAAGVEKADINTSHLNLAQNEQNNRYEATNILTMRVRKLDTLDRLIADLVRGGGNSLQGIAFESSDIRATEAKLRIAALRDAQEKAKALAEAAGAQLGDIVTITASDAGHPQGAAPMRVGMRAAMPNVPVEGGTIRVQQEVATTWLLQ